MAATSAGRVVTHPDRHDSGTVTDTDAPAWTPNDLAVDAPDAGIVKVRWSDSADPTHFYWEYVTELRAAVR
jgi:hypothetical protein